jgi:hypothetical protein
MHEHLKANEPCPCGSGDPYKKCHKTLHRTPPGRYLDEARKFYVGRWVRNAGAHDRANDYDWMCGQVRGDIARLIDIGVGEGSGLAAMLRNFRPERAIGIEENPECVRRARTKLAAAGASFDVVSRMRTQQVSRDAPDYCLAFEQGPISAASGVTVIETDPLFDAALADDLIAAGPFDLVTVWLVGSHEAREHSVELNALGHMTSARYRELVQQSSYGLADKVLAPGGRIQIVDRLPMQDRDGAREHFRALHEAHFQGTSLEIEAIGFREYREAANGGVGMLVKDHGQGTPIGNEHAMLLMSVVSVKR